MKIIVPRKAAKKIDALRDDSNPNTDVLSDTTLRVADTIKTWKQFFDVLEHEIINYPDDSVEEEDDYFTAKLRHIA